MPNAPPCIHKLSVSRGARWGHRAYSLGSFHCRPRAPTRRWFRSNRQLRNAPPSVHVRSPESTSPVVMNMKCLLLALAVLGGQFSIVGSGFAQTWTQTGAPVTNWSAVATSADGARLLAAVSGGLIYTSTNSGATWTATTAPGMNWSALASSADGT